MSVDLNPELTILKMKYKNINFNVVQEGYLIGGTKQRMIAPIIQNSTCSEFVYAGPVYGYAQIALSYVGKLFNKKVTLFVEKLERRWHLTNRALEFSPNLIEVEQPAPLKKVQGEAMKYVEKIKKEKGNDYICYISFGLIDDKDFLVKQLLEAVPNGMNVKTMWLVIGSGTLLSALYEVFPNAFFNVVQVGKKVFFDQLDIKRTRLFISPENFNQIAEEQPPYETVATYDAKLWRFFKEFGQGDDYIWNVGIDKGMGVENLQLKKGLTKFPFMKNWIGNDEIVGIINGVKEYKYEEHLVYNLDIIKNKYGIDISYMIINRKVDYYKYNILADIVCEMCLIKGDGVDLIGYFYKNKEKLIKETQEKYGEVTDYFVRNVLFNKQLERWPRNITNIVSVMEFLNLNNKGVKILDFNVDYGEGVICANLFDWRYDYLKEGSLCKKTNNVYEEMINYLNKLMRKKNNGQIKSYKSENEYDVIFTKNMNDSLFKNLSVNGYVVLFTNKPEKKYDKILVFAQQNMRDFEFAIIYKNK